MTDPDLYLFLMLAAIAIMALCTFILGRSWATVSGARRGAMLVQGLAREVRFRYRSANGAAVTLHAVIYEVVQRRGRMYFGGLCLPSQQPRTFRVDRVEHLMDLHTGEIADDTEAWFQRLIASA